MKRVNSLLQKYCALCIGLSLTFGEDFIGDGLMILKDDNVPIAKFLRDMILEDQERDKRENQFREMKEKERLETERQKQMELENELKLKQREQDAMMESERNDLARRAEIARINRLESMRRAEENRIEAEREFLASVEVGPNGIRKQLERLRSSCQSEEEMNTAIGALHTLFSQISAHPEEIKFRRIRRDHEKFVSDIGRHDGGEGFFIAAGFHITEIDGKQCFFSKEPSLEVDMDSWSKVSDELFFNCRVDNCADKTVIVV